MEEGPHNAPLTRAPMSGQRWQVKMSLQIPPMFVGHILLGGFNEGCFCRGHCQEAHHLEMCFQVMCLLRSLGFWSPINKGF